MLSPWLLWLISMVVPVAVYGLYRVLIYVAWSPSRIIALCLALASLAAISPRPRQVVR